MGSMHARVMHSSPLAELAVVVEPREDVGREVADRYGAAWAPDLSGLEGVDAVVVAAATGAHRQLALQVIDAGLPLLVEKPVADDLAASQEVVDASAAKGTPLMCGLLERFNSAVATAFSLAREPVQVSTTRHGPYASRIKTGVAWDLLVHDVDLAVRLLGEPTGVTVSSAISTPSRFPAPRTSPRPS